MNNKISKISILINGGIIISLLITLCSILQKGSALSAPFSFINLLITAFGINFVIRFYFKKRTSEFLMKRSKVFGVIFWLFVIVSSIQLCVFAVELYWLQNQQIIETLEAARGYVVSNFSDIELDFISMDTISKAVEISAFISIFVSYMIQFLIYFIIFAFLSNNFYRK